MRDAHPGALVVRTSAFFGPWDRYNFVHLALAQMAPGPLAAQLGIYLGYVHYRIRGATLAGIAFVLPSFLMVVALGWAYARFGGPPWMQAVFYGVGAAVIGIIAMSAKKQGCTEAEKFLQSRWPELREIFRKRWGRAGFV